METIVGKSEAVERVADLIDAQLYHSPDITNAQLAAKLVTDLSRDDPELLLAWGRETLIARMNYAITERAGRARNQAIRRTAGLFERLNTGTPLERLKAREELQRGDVFLRQAPAINDAWSRKLIGQLNKADCKFISGSYKTSGERDLRLAGFWHRIAEQIGDRTVEESYDPVDFAEALAQMERPL